MASSTVTRTKNGYLAIEGSAATAEEAIRLCGNALSSAGYTLPGFAQGCIEREKEYPTGICSEVPVALPHCMSTDIVTNALCYLRLSEPVEFRRMDDDRVTVRTRHIFNLAIDRGDHLAFLSRVMGILQDVSVLRSLETMDINEVSEYLRMRVESEE